MYISASREWHAGRGDAGQVYIRGALEDRLYTDQASREALFSTSERKSCLQAKTPFFCWVLKSVYILPTCVQTSCHKPAPNYLRINPYKSYSRTLSLSLINKNISPKTSSNKTAHAENVIAEKTKTDICTSGNRISMNGKKIRIEHTLGHVPFCFWFALQGVRVNSKKWFGQVFLMYRPFWLRRIQCKPAGLRFYPFLFWQSQVGSTCPKSWNSKQRCTSNNAMTEGPSKGLDLLATLSTQLKVEYDTSKA